jgi:tetratricopeptide (TPR) repeat protein
MRKSFQKESFFILGLFIFAFLIRFIYLNQIKSSPLFDVPLLDAQYHDQWAQAILKGQDFEKGVFFRAPLYPYFLASVYKIFGHNFYIARLIQLIIGSLSCVLVYLIGKKVFNPRVGRIAGIIASLYGVLIYFEGDLLLEGLSVFLDLVLVLALLSTKAKPSYGRLIICGGLLGLSALARPNVLLVGVAFFFWILFYFPPGREFVKSKGKNHTAHTKVSISKKSLLYAVFFTLGAILVISPVTLRNYVKGKDFVLIASQGGMNFYIGNNPQSDGVSAFLPGARGTWWGLHDDATRIAEESMHKKLKPSQVSQFWYGQGMKFIKKHPFDFLRLTMKKLALFWNGNELSNNKDIYFFAKRSGILKGLIWRFVIYFPFGIMCPLALLGMILSYKQFKNTLALLLFIFVYMSSVILFFVTARFRVQVLPFLIIFSAYALNWFLIKIKEKRFSQVAKSFLILVLISIPINLHIPGYQDLGVAWSHFNLGYAYGDKKDFSNAIQEYQMALSYDPNFADAYLSLGALYRQQGKYTLALQELEKALSHGADTVLVLCNRGMIYSAFGLLDKAEEDYKLSIALRGNDYFPHHLLGEIYEDKSMWEQAIAEFELALQYNPEFAPAYYELGLIYQRLGKKDQAVSALENFLKIGGIDPNQIEDAQRLLRKLKTE